MWVAWRRLAALGSLIAYIGACLLVAWVESRPDVLRQTWETYRRDFITADGRVVDPPPSGWGETTSEAQSYAMLRAVWLGDRPVFDRTWRWTRVNLQVRGDSLFGWLWGRDQAGAWTLLSENTAADADEDIALALVFASRRWSEERYLTAARSVIAGIWAKEVAWARGRPYLVAGDWAGGVRDQVVINPSYLAPYAYRVFAAVDPGHRWLELVRTSYDVLERCSWSRLDEDPGVGLPPNWCVLSPYDGAAHGYSGADGDDYGLDAFRVMWRVALDDEWNGSPAAAAYLAHSGFLRREWRLHHRLEARYAHDGTAYADAGEKALTYAGDLGDFVVNDPAAARSIVQNELLATLRRDRGGVDWGHRSSYYAENWIWFGVALAQHRLVNLAQGPVPLGASM
ncbi:MAG TPA: glycosyl hydrolase family 8 [Candidatus Dormibacteraeota bacterium]|nr:glycosyl hydrolase family 8 [Candidatus Dormibacteraeota bacterium]